MSSIWNPDGTMRQVSNRRSSTGGGQQTVQLYGGYGHDTNVRRSTSNDGSGPSGYGNGGDVTAVLAAGVRIKTDEELSLDPVQRPGSQNKLKHVFDSKVFDDNVPWNKQLTENAKKLFVESSVFTDDGGAPPAREISPIGQRLVFESKVFDASPADEAVVTKREVCEDKLTHLYKTKVFEDDPVAAERKELSAAARRVLFESAVFDMTPPTPEEVPIAPQVSENKQREIKGTVNIFGTEDPVEIRQARGGIRKSPGGGSNIEVTELGINTTEEVTLTPPNSIKVSRPPGGHSSIIFG